MGALALTDFAHDAELLARFAEERGDQLAADNIRMTARRVVRGESRRDSMAVVAESTAGLTGAELLKQLMAGPPARSTSAVGMAIGRSKEHVWHLANGLRPITQEVAELLSEKLWPEFPASRFVTSAASARRAS